MPNVFTEAMNRTNPDDPSSSITTIDNYIRYMVERVEFSIKGVFKAASAAGSSSAEVMQAVAVLRDTVSILSSALNRLQGDVVVAQGAIVNLQDGMSDAQDAISALQSDVLDIKTTLGDANGGLVKEVADIKAAIGDTSTVGTILYQLHDLDTRVDALEHPNNNS